MDIFAIYNLILSTVGFIAGILIFMHLPRLNKTTKRDLGISVIIPARNESNNIGNILLDLRAQTLKPAEIICVDDESTDNTSQIAAQAGARIIQAGPHPEDWIGKAWACQKGANAALADVLLFLDADVRLAPDAIMKLAAEYHDGAVSVQPYHMVNSFFEYFSMFFNIIAVAATGVGMPLARPTGMFGPVLLVSKIMYYAHGGHEAVKSKIIEDFCLGEHYHSQGMPLKLFVGKPAISYRMFSNVKSLWQGWTKNFFSGAVSVSIPMLLLCIIWLTAQTGASIALVLTLSQGHDLFSLYTMAVVLFVLQTFYMARQVGNFRWPAMLLFPVFLLGFYIIFFVSAIKKLVFRKVTWKGRDIDMREK